MKKVFLLIVFCLTLNIITKAQTKDEQQLTAAVETLKKYMIDPNKQQLQQITVKELSYGHSNGLMEDQAAFIDALVSGKSDFVSIDLTDQTISVVGNTALVRHNLSGQTLNSGTPGTVKLGVLLVWQKQQGTWKLLARQAFKL